MSELAAIRPDAVDLPLFIHVLSAFILIGAVALVLVALTGALRGDTTSGMRLAFRSLLYAAIPSWIVMRLTAQWLLDEQGLEDADLEWIEIGFATAEPTFLLLVLATVITWRRSRAPEGSRNRLAHGIATGLVSTALLAFLFALWAMTTKPV